MHSVLVTAMKVLVGLTALAVAITYGQTVFGSIPLLNATFAADLKKHQRHAGGMKWATILLCFLISMGVLVTGTYKEQRGWHVIVSPMLLLGTVLYMIGPGNGLRNRENHGAAGMLVVPMVLLMALASAGWFLSF